MFLDSLNSLRRNKKVRGKPSISLFESRWVVLYEAWETLNSDTSRQFDNPKNGRIAVKVINHFGDEVMKVFRV